MSSCSVTPCSSDRSLAGLNTRASVRSLRAVALLIGLCITSAAHGAAITVHPEDNYGRIFVDIAGDITLADIKTFSDNVARLPSEKVYVSLSSEGGSAVAAEIGNYIRLSGMKTLVPENKRCVSICAIIWLGARERYVGADNAAIGFHGAYDINTGQPGSTNVLIATYLGYLGLSYSAVDWILGAPPLAIRWLTSETSQKYGIYYSELTPKRAVPFVDERVARTPGPPEPTPRPSQPEPSPPLLPQTASKRPFHVVDASEGFLNIRNGPGPTYPEIAEMPLGATGLVGRCVRLQGGWKPFCEVDWQGVSGWASSCCMAEVGEPTQFTYRVTQNLILRSNPDKSSWNMLTNAEPNDFIPEGTRFTWKSRPEDCTAGIGGEVWCRLTYTPRRRNKNRRLGKRAFMRSTITGMFSRKCLLEARALELFRDNLHRFPHHPLSHLTINHAEWGSVRTLNPLHNASPDL